MALPKDYRLPQDSSHYMKLEDGKNTIRIMSEIIVGEEYWVTDTEGNRKPKRVKTADDLPMNVKKAQDREGRSRHFWAMLVFNFQTKDFQILQITQKGIMKMLESLEKDTENWGDLRNYNITILKTRTGSNPFDVEYSVSPLPPKPLDEGILMAFQEIRVNLENLYEGNDPFE